MPSYGKNFFESTTLDKNEYQKAIRKFLAEKLSIYQSRVFLCHASEDKDTIVISLANALNSAQIDYWLDSAAIKLGDSLTEKVNEGLRTSEYFVLVLSKFFINKPWPERELNSILSINISNKKKPIIPILAGTNEEQQLIRNNYPLLHDIYYFSWQNNPDKFIELLKERIKKDMN